MQRLAVLAALVLLPACGGSTHRAPSASRAAVTAYLTRVNNTELLMQKPLRAVSTATAAFTHAHNSAATAAVLAGAQGTMDDLYARLVLVTPPAPAKRLHSLLLALVQRQASLAGELHDLTVFNPAFSAAIQPVVAASAQARKALRGTKKTARVAAAIHAYRTAIEGVVVRIRHLRPPAVERPLFEAQLTRLIALSSALAGFEHAVRTHDLTATARFQHAVSVASVSADTHANQLAQRAAVVAYDARVSSVQALATRVQRERDRLQATLQ